MKKQIDEVQQLIEDVCEQKLLPKYDNEDLEMFERDDDSNQDVSYVDEEDFQGETAITAGFLVNFQEKFEEILQNEEVGDAIELNEKFLAEHLGIPQDELSRLQKIELRVDTSCHNLQVTGEILSSIEYLKMNDSIIKCFRDLGTSFKFVRVLHLARCELKEVQGIQAFLNLEELYLSYNSIDDMFDISFLDHLAVLDLEGNNLCNDEHLYYLKRLKQLTHLNLASNPVSECKAYYSRIQQNAPNLLVLDDELVLGSSFFERKQQQQPSNQKALNVNWTNIELFNRLIKVGISEEIIKETCAKEIALIDTDQLESYILSDAIKSQTLDFKAARQFQDYDQVTDKTIERAKTPNIHMKITKESEKLSVTPSKRIKISSNSFSKSSTKKIASMTNENDGGVGNRSIDILGEVNDCAKMRTQAIPGQSNKIQILRRRQSELNNDHDNRSKKDGTECNLVTNLTKVQAQAPYVNVPYSASAFYYNPRIIDREQSQSTSRSRYQDCVSGTRHSSIKQHQSTTTLQNFDAYAIIQGANCKENKLRASFASGISGKNVEKIVLKASDIHFSASFKRKKD